MASRLTSGNVTQRRIWPLPSQANPHIGMADHIEWLDRVTPERVNFRSALRWSIDSGEGTLALRLAGSLWRLWHAFGQVADGRQLTEEALAMPEAPTGGSDRAWALAAAGSLAYWQADAATARRHYEAQIRLYRTCNRYFRGNAGRVTKKNKKHPGR